MIDLDFTNLHTDPPRVTRPDDAILGVVGDFSIVVEGRVLYAEPEFPLVEFARSILSWLHRGESSGDDYEYDSAEAAEPGLVWLRHEGDGWRIGSIHQEYPELTTFSVDVIRSTVDDFVRRLRQRSIRELGIDVSRLLPSAK